VEKETVIRIENLVKRYGKQTAVNNLNLEVLQGEVFGFLGPNGAGKTTTMLMMLGLAEPDSGTVRICGFDPGREALKVKELIGYLPENTGFYDDMDARGNLRFIARLNNIPDSASSTRIDRLLEDVDLAKETNKKVGGYSKGMRQRLGIAEALIKEPRVVFLDEPTVGLDPEGTNRMLDMIRDLSRRRGMTVFFSSHLLDQVQRISDRVGIMIAGSLAAVGTLAELAEKGLGIKEGEVFALEDIYMKYFREA
jgi:ABC-2 type transport system ATP-binding protein